MYIPSDRETSKWCPTSIVSCFQSHNSHEAGDLMSLVRTAAERLPGLIWADKRWSERFIAGFGGRVLKNESFMMMVPSEEGGEEPRLAVYLHGR